MLNAKSNKEIVAAGHSFAKNLPADTGLMDMAKMVSELATRLDVANVRATVMAGEVLRINSIMPDAIAALNATGDHMSLVANLNAAMVTPAANEWIKALQAEAVVQTRKYVQTMTNRQQPGVSHVINLISQLEMDMLRTSAGKDGEQ